MSDKEEKIKKSEEDYNKITKDIVKKELLSKLERKFQENDPAILNALKSLINESKITNNDEDKWNTNK